MRKHAPDAAWRHPRDLSEESVQRLVDRLNSLKEGDLAVADLVECGKRAVEPLRRVLLHGKPSGIFRPRQRAVEALAALGAQNVLLEYLTSVQHIADPVDRYGEEAVENTAARMLSASRDEDVYNALLQLLRRRQMPGVIEALGEFRRTDAMPELIAALGDSVCRIAAEEALRKTGEAARQALLDAARTPYPSASHETPSSICRRRSALRLLAELNLSAEALHDLSALAHDRDPEIAARWNRVMLANAEEYGKKLAARRLIEALPNAAPFLQMEIEEWLLWRSEIARTTLDEEIARRRLATAAGRPTDMAVRLLLAVRNRIGGGT